MKKQLIISSLIITGVFVVFACNQAKTSPEKKIADNLIKQVDSFINLSKNLEHLVERNTDEKDLQQSFLNTRIAYKKFEWAAEYFEPATSRFVNGAPVAEIETTGQTFEPAGLQVIEALLFPKNDTAKKTELIQQLIAMQQRCEKYKMHFANIDFFNWQIFDAAKLEVFRIETTGITGFDNPLTLQSMQESNVALQSIRSVFANYDEAYVKKFDDYFNAAENYLVSNTDFNSFDREKFITAYCNPLSTAIQNLQDNLKIVPVHYNRLLNQNVKTLFDTNAYNINAFAPDQSSFVSKAKIELGKKLFSDPILSGGGERSCQSCHQPNKAFTDGLVKNTMLSSNETLKRNTPTLINAALQSAQFYDLRVNTLEDQSLDVVQSTVEMHGSMKVSVQKLWKDSVYKKMFDEAFPKKGRNNIDTIEVMNAIGSYVRSLVFFNSRFDEYMRGNLNALNANEVNGFNLFMGKAKCATCHYMPLFNGTFAPRYMKTEAEVIGVPQSTSTNIVDSDLGRYDIVKVESLKHAFKTPGIRNAALTAPYMHNGVFTTLEQVINFYNKGGGIGLGEKINNQTLPFDKLNLTGKEQNDIVDFIKALTSK